MVTVGPELRRVPVDCPLCGLALPPIPVVLEPQTAGGRIVVKVRAVPDDAWRDRVRVEHPGCAGLVEAAGR